MLICSACTEISLVAADTSTVMVSSPAKVKASKSVSGAMSYLLGVTQAGSNTAPDSSAAGAASSA